ncbi:MAG: AraC family transcriptional regulator [Treponema sp.]|jgi:AraC-like DNA-binding protein|nr:AraC family transcriptional regulator [Treponema sp.]
MDEFPASTQNSVSNNSFLHYPPYSKEDEKLGMLCTTAGHVEVPPLVPYPPYKNDHPVIFRSVSEGRALPEFDIIYVIKGLGNFECLGKTFRVVPGSVLLLLPGVWHRYSPDFETGWHEFWVGFKGDYFNRLLEEKAFSTDKIFFKAGINETMLKAFEMIFDEIKNQRPLYQFKACSSIIAIIAEILTLDRRQEQPDFYHEIVNKAKTIMESNIFGSINLPNISGQVGVSTSHLNEIFKTYTSMTPYQFFIHIKILKAETLLEREDISVKEAAFRLGFEDQYHFSRLFKNKTGVSPSEWKKYISR